MTTKLAGASPVDRGVSPLLDEGTNACGPRGTYGCACVSRDMRECIQSSRPARSAP